MQIKLKKDCTYLTDNLEGLHVCDVKKVKGTNALQYTVRLDSNDETDNCSSDGSYLSSSMVLDKNYNPIQTIAFIDFKNSSYISDTFCIFKSHDSVLNNAATHNFLSSTTVHSKVEKIIKKHKRLISMLTLS